MFDLKALLYLFVIFDEEIIKIKLSLEFILALIFLLISNNKNLFMLFLLNIENAIFMRL